MTDTVTVMPHKMDVDLARQVVWLLRNAPPDAEGQDERVVALMLHRWRKTREGELRGNLVKLGGVAESRKFQLIRLNGAHVRLLRRYRTKIQDCDRLKQALRDRGFNLDEIKTLLRAPA